MKSFFIVFLSFCFTILFAKPADFFKVCASPQNVAVTSLNVGNVSFDWDDCSGGCTEYKVNYTRREDSYTSSDFITANSAISFSSLTDGTYDFYFYTVCGSQTSSFIVVEEIIMD